MEQVGDDPTARFFADLSKRTLRLPPDTCVKVGIDLGHDGETDHWFVKFDGSRAHVAREGGDAIVTIRTRKELFDRIATGEANLLAALYRNEITFEGRLAYLAYLRASLPNQPGAVDPRVLARQTAGLGGANSGRN